jgi:hypothetical protein
MIRLQGIKSFIKGELDDRDMKVFHSVGLAGFHCHDGLQLAISFQTIKKVERWEAFPNLMFGNLVCLSPRGHFEQVRYRWQHCLQ